MPLATPSPGVAEYDGIAIVTPPEADAVSQPIRMEDLGRQVEQPAPVTSYSMAATRPCLKIASTPRIR